MNETSRGTMPFFFVADMLPIREGKDEGDSVVQGTLFYYPSTEQNLFEVKINFKKIFDFRWFFSISGD